MLTSFFQRAPLSVIAPSGWIRLKFNLTLIASLLAEVLWIQQLYRFHKFLLCERNQVLPISVLYWSSLQWGCSYKFGEAWGQYLYLFIYGLQSIFEVCTLFDIYICVYFFFSLSDCNRLFPSTEDAGRWECSYHHSCSIGHRCSWGTLFLSIILKVRKSSVTSFLVILSLYLTIQTFFS